MSSPPLYVTILLVPVVIGVIIRFAFPNSFIYSIWSDRDLLRALQIWENFPVEGAEINGAYYARVPGGFYYYLLALFQALSKLPTAIYILLSGAITAGFYAVYRSGREIYGLVGALAATGAYALSPGVLSTARQIWNPALTLPMTAIVFLLLIRVLRGKAWALPWLIALLVATIQVHMSNLALLAGVLCVLVVVPHGAKLKHWAVSLLAALSVITPYLIVEMANGFVNAKLILEGHGQKLYSAPSFGPLLETLTLIAGGGKPGSDSLLDLCLTGLAVALMIGIFVRVALAILRCRFSLSPLRWRTQLASANESERLILSLAFVVVFCSCLLAINRNSAIYVRYILFLIPPIALLSGAVVSEVLARREGKIWSTVTAILFTALFAVQGYVHSAHLSGNPVSGLTTLIEDLRTQAGFSDNDLRSKVLLLGTEENFQFHQAGYLIAISSRTKPEKSYKGCVVTVNASEKNEALSRISSAFSVQDFTPPSLEYLFQTEGQFVFGYELAEGNCYASLINAYDLSPVERDLHRACKVAEVDGLLLTQEIRGDTHKRFVLRQTFPPTRLCLGLDMEIVQGQIRTTLTSTHLKGYTGYTISYYSLNEAKLSFEDEEGGSHDISLIETPLGGQGNILTTPWRTLGNLPPNGDYRLIFKGKLTAKKDNNFKDEKIKLVLSEKITIASDMTK